MQVVGQQKGFDAREVIDHENGGTVGDILRSINIQAGTGETGDGFYGQSGSAVCEMVH
jgi:hypothetical protein